MFQNWSKAVCLGGFAAALFMTSAVPALAETNYRCKFAIENYGRSFDYLSIVFKSYARCLNSSDPKDDCSIEFSSLRIAQMDFESAVSEIKFDCD